MSNKFNVNSEDFRCRLVQLIESLTDSKRGKSKFARYIGISNSYLSDIINGRSGPSFSLISGIAEYFPTVNIHWLLTGEGDLFMPPESPIVENEPSVDIDQVTSRVRSLKELRDKKDVATLLELSPTEFENRKKRGTLLSKFVKWGLEENVNLNWLLTGKQGSTQPEGSQPQEGQIEIELLSGVIKGVEDYLKEAESILDPEPKARLVSLLYDRFAEAGKNVDQKTVASYLKLVA